MSTTALILQRKWFKLKAQLIVMMIEVKAIYSKGWVWIKLLGLKQIRNQMQITCTAAHGVAFQNSDVKASSTAGSASSVARRWAMPLRGSLKDWEKNRRKNVIGAICKRIFCMQICVEYPRFDLTGTTNKLCCWRRYAFIWITTKYHFVFHH